MLIALLEIILYFLVEILMASSGRSITSLNIGWKLSSNNDEIGNYL